MSRPKYFTRHKRPVLNYVQLLLSRSLFHLYYCTLCLLLLNKQQMAPRSADADVPGVPQFTWDEVKEHTARDDRWIVIEGQVRRPFLRHSQVLRARQSSIITRVSKGPTRVPTVTRDSMRVPPESQLSHVSALGSHQSPNGHTCQCWGPTRVPMVTRVSVGVPPESQLSHVSVLGSHQSPNCHTCQCWGPARVPIVTRVSVGVPPESQLSHVSVLGSHQSPNCHTCQCWGPTRVLTSSV